MLGKTLYEKHRTHYSPETPVCAPGASTSLSVITDKLEIHHSWSPVDGHNIRIKPLNVVNPAVQRVRLNPQFSPVYSTSEDAREDRIFIEKVLESFRKKYGTIIYRRRDEVAQQYPVDFKRFFMQTPKDGLGQIFEEEFRIDPASHMSVRQHGFRVHTHTDSYTASFGYYETGDEIQPVFQIIRGPWGCGYGYGILFDRQLDVRKLFEIDKAYSADSDEKNEEIRKLMLQLWNEFKDKCRINQRIKDLESITLEDYRAAEKIRV